MRTITHTPIATQMDAAWVGALTVVMMLASTGAGALLVWGVRRWWMSW
jgi:hypothetical protein